MKLVKKARKVLAGMMVMSMMLGGIVVTNPMELSALEQTKGSQKRNVMYYGDWSVWGGQGNFYPQQISADLLTHLNFAFLDFDAQGNLIFTDKDAATENPLGQSGVTWGDVNAGILPALIQLRAENPNLKIGVSVGGWSKSGDFSAMAANPTSRARFVENMMKFIEYTDMDFVDIDWEYPADVRQPDLVDNKNDEGTPNARPEDKENYILLLQDLKNALDQKEIENGKTYELSVALPVSPEKLAKGVDVQRMFEIIDFANIMTYDMRGAFDPISGHQAGLYPNANDPYKDRGFTTDEAVNYMIKEGAPAEKLVIGAAYYTRGWEKVTGGTDANNPGLFGEAAIVGKDADQTPSRGAANELPLASGDGGRRGGVWSYRNLDRLKATYPGIREYWDDEAKAPYLYDAQSGAFFTYDNERSIGEKTKYVHENDLGGVIGWMAGQDAVTSSGKRDALTKATKKGLFGESKLTEHEIVYNDLDIAVQLTTYQEPWGNNSGYQIAIKNNEILQEQGEVLSRTEAIAETVVLPKLYIKHNGPALSSGGYGSGTVTQDGEYTVVDLSSVYEGKAIKPGQTYNIQLRSAGPVTDISGIESIELVQRITKEGTEIKRQTIYGDVETVNQAPVIKGVEDRTITVGDVFDPMAGVSALDKEDGTITDRIQVTGAVDNSQAGQYVLTYTVADTEGLTASVTRTITVQEYVEPEIPESDFGVGEGIVWDAQVNAPFVDMGSWITKPGYANDGAPNLVKLAEDTGVQYFNLGFIQSVNGQIRDNKVVWGWAGLEALSESGPDHTQYLGIKKSIKELREMGGDVAISLGGANGITFWEATQDVDILTNTYMELVTGYGLTRLDLDIEGGSATNKAYNETNAKAIKRVQDATGVDVVLTLAVAPDGLTYKDQEVLKAYLEAGVDVEVVNLMTMCYGPANLLPGENYGTASLRAVDSTKDQIKTFYRDILGQTLTDAEAYAKIGTTPSIGFEGAAHPIFTTGWAQLVVDHAKEKGLAMTSFWSMNRDAELESNQGIPNQYAFTDIFKTFTEGQIVNRAPEIKGANAITLTVGDVFDPMAGVTATDREDGDLTSSIVVTGTVDTAVSGTYELVYTVSDREGLETVVRRQVIVEPKVNKAPVINGVADQTIYLGDAFDPMAGVTASDEEDGDLTAAIVVEGAVDVNAVGSYTLTYTVTDSEGKTATKSCTVRVKDSSVLEDTYDLNEIYNTGDKVIYNGKEYTAKWWTKGETPGVAAVWEETIVPNPDGSQDYVPGKAYVEGDIVIYNGKTYKAKWWTNTVPGTDDSWELVGGSSGEGEGDQVYQPGKAYVGGDVVSYEGTQYRAKWWTTALPGSDDSWEKL
ncbi:MAG: glycosyl hydrolase family 18 protein [Cellulosilyticaceae bacterium]